MRAGPGTRQPVMTESASAPPYYLPNKIGRSILLALEEVIGHTGVNAVLNLADLAPRLNNYPPDNLDLGYRFEELSALQAALERMYGPRGGRGLALRTGRAWFKYGLREFGTMLGMTELAFRLLPLNMKLKATVEGFADIYNRYTDQVVQLEEQPGGMLWQILRCPVCWGRHADTPCCHLEVGMLQETLYWASGGKNFLVDEIACCARGDPSCTILIHRLPLD